MEKVTIKPGCGYWDCTKYPIGGCFCRVPRDGAGLEVANVQKMWKSHKGADHTGTTADGRSVAFGIEATTEGGE